ncbi:DNA (cytosine-5-)-methyltransferase [Cellulomonas endophytica]|uniref:DNA (cytosine-5-)-methyltransferase n=1 Tax=Cellulomonas endophytica TaxID=2494735 RepID=UPI001012C088|nr:DNA (cytosine-5-)-methyltransferase [Cellulomonas endophytica]
MDGWEADGTIVGVDATEAAPQPAFTFVDLFAGIGGFHAALSALGGQCVYVSEIDQDARDVYRANWGEHVNPYDASAQPMVGETNPAIRGDINDDAPQREDPTYAGDGTMRVPPHDVLAAGFPCQAFSKSGSQQGVLDKTRGTLFFNIIRILQERRPKIVFLENVRNLAGPRHLLTTWQTIIDALEELGYEVSREPMVVSPHLIPAHHGGTPQVRDRVFIMAIYKGVDRRALAKDIRPTLRRAEMAKDAPVWDLATTPIPWLGGRPILQQDEEVSDLQRYAVTGPETEWIDAWDAFVQIMRGAGVALPGHPIWTEYFVRKDDLPPDRLAVLVAMPPWKQNFVRKNMLFYKDNESLVEQWKELPVMARFDEFPESRRKLEWQAQDAESLWDCLLQLRPSGIRAKLPTYVPALVAITQTSIVGRRRRRLTPREVARLQGFDDSFTFAGKTDAAAYKQMGNGVSAGAVHYSMCRFVDDHAEEVRRTLPGLVDAVRLADGQGWRPPRGGGNEAPRLHLPAAAGSYLIDRSATATARPTASAARAQQTTGPAPASPAA